MAAIERHFPASLTAPQYLFIQSPHDLRTTKALSDLEQMAQRVAQLPDIAIGARRHPAHRCTAGAGDAQLPGRRDRQQARRRVVEDQRRAPTSAQGADRRRRQTRRQPRHGAQPADQDDLDARRSAARRSRTCGRSCPTRRRSRRSRRRSPSSAPTATRVRASATSPTPPVWPTTCLDRLNNDPNCDADPSCAPLKDRLSKPRRHPASGAAVAGRGHEVHAGAGWPTIRRRPAEERGDTGSGCGRARRRQPQDRRRGAHPRRPDQTAGRGPVARLGVPAGDEAQRVGPWRRGFLHLPGDPRQRPIQGPRTRSSCRRTGIRRATWWSPRWTRTTPRRWIRSRPSSPRRGVRRPTRRWPMRRSRCPA